MIEKANIAKLLELLPDCAKRAVAWHEEAYPIIPFRVTEAYRTKERQYSLFTQGRTLQSIESLYRGKVLSDAQYEALRAIYAAGKNLQGKIVTWTLHSRHFDRVAFDVFILNAKTILEQRRALNCLDKLGRFFGVYRPTETYRMGDYVHFEVYNLPPTPLSALDIMIKTRLKGRMEKLNLSNAPNWF